jgi:hypothetical protein
MYRQIIKKKKIIIKKSINIIRSFMPKDEVSNKKRTEVKTKKDLKQEWETEGKGLGYDTPEEYFNDFYGPLEMNTGGITGAAVSEKEYKDLKKSIINDKVKKFSGAAVSEKEYFQEADLKKSMPKASLGLLIGAGADKLLKGSESARSLTKNLGLTGNLLGNYYDKKASKDVNQKTTTQQVTTKKSGGMTKGQKKIRTVMREFKAKKLKSSSGQKVTNPKQAIAIALSEAGQSKKMKKAKGGAFITKGGDYIKDLL